MHLLLGSHQALVLTLQLELSLQNNFQNIQLAELKGMALLALSIATKFQHLINIHLLILV